MIKVSVKGKVPDIRRKILSSITEATNEFVAKVRKDTPVDTGLLQRSWLKKRQFNGEVISNPQDYASFVEDNVRFIDPHIEPLKRNIVNKVKRKTRTL